MTSIPAKHPATQIESTECPACTPPAVTWPAPWFMAPHELYRFFEQWLAGDPGSSAGVFLDTTGIPPFYLELRRTVLRLIVHAPAGAPTGWEEFLTRCTVDVLTAAWHCHCDTHGQFLPRSVEQAIAAVSSEPHGFSTLHRVAIDAIHIFNDEIDYSTGSKCLQLLTAESATSRATTKP